MKLANKDELVWSVAGGAIKLSPGRGRVSSICWQEAEALWRPETIDDDWNIGGERLWFGPERNWFWQKTDRVDFNHYQVPTGLNPDEWQVLEADDSVCSCTLEIRLEGAHSANHISLRVDRRFENLSAATALAEGRSGLSFRTTTRLEILEGTTGQAIDLWSILQVPVGGMMRAPVLGAPQARDYFDPCPADDQGLVDGTYSLKIGGSNFFKVGLNPEVVSGRVRYERPVSGGTLILERSFPVHPTLRYCDAPLNATSGQGDVLQFFNDGGGFGRFGEMEHRSPALICGIGPQSYMENAVTHVFLKA